MYCTCSRIHERNGDRELNPLQWNGALSIGQELAAQGVIEAIKQKESFYLGCVRGWKTEMLFYGIEEALQKEKEFVSQRQGLTLYWN